MPCCVYVNNVDHIAMPCCVYVNNVDHIARFIVLMKLFI